MKTITIDINNLNSYDAMDLKEIIEDAGMTESYFSVDVNDPENGSEVYKAVYKKYLDIVGLKEINFITNQLMSLYEVEVTEK